MDIREEIKNEILRRIKDCFDPTKDHVGTYMEHVETFKSYMKALEKEARIRDINSNASNDKEEQ